MFSGLVKLNDPVGSQIKLEEYFDVFAGDFGDFFQVFIPYALPIGLFLVILEVTVGLAVIFSHRMEITSRILLFLIVFFTYMAFSH